LAGHAAETLIGAAVVAAAAGFLIFAGRTTGFGDDAGGSYQLVANFRSAEGVRVGTDVRLAGVKIGTVTALDLDRETYQARTTFTVLDGLDLPDDSEAKISTEGLLGGTFLEITPGASEFVLEENEEILNTQGAISFLNLLMKFVTDEAQ
jgi:phospholipid/cholesterol/gamma-HCH transport system substrate-binding protein